MILSKGEVDIPLDYHKRRTIFPVSPVHFHAFSLVVPASLTAPDICPDGIEADSYGKSMKERRFDDLAAKTVQRRNISRGKGVANICWVAHYKNMERYNLSVRAR
jgi:hypothetical protein